MWLPVLAVIGMLIPNGIFVYWLLHDYTSLSAALSDRMAMPFIIDVFASTFFLAWLFARKPVGPYKWPWFLGLCLVGTLIFGLPCYLWLNWRKLPEPRPGFSDWWRDV